MFMHQKKLMYIHVLLGLSGIQIENFSMPIASQPPSANYNISSYNGPQCHNVSVSKFFDF
jgi:hypothetical protein